MRNSRKLLGLSMLFFTSLSIGGCTSSSDPSGPVEIKMSVIWNGLSSMKPSGDPYETRVAKKIEQETGVRIKVTWVNGTENENLVRVFATGKNMPDCIMAPYWGGGDACSSTIRQAAKDRLIVPLDDYIAESDNLAEAYTVGVARNFIDNELSVSEFKGKKYIIPMHTPDGENEMQNWGYTVYARKDILESLQVDPSSIHTSNDLYELAKDIRDGGFKDINGNDIIPASCWGNGWSYETYLNSFKRRGFTNIIDKGDHFEWSADQPELESEVKFMWKMVNEGLFDKTAFSHSETQALTKHSTGGVGLTSAHYPYIKNALKNVLYKDHPEMRYVPLGPINDLNGDPYMPSTVQEKNGYYGFAVLMVTKDCKNVPALMRYLDYINSEEGKYLAYLGEEGIDYTKDQLGKPHMTQAFFDAEKQNDSYAYDNGFDSYFTFGVSRVPFNTFDSARAETPDTYKAAVKEMYPLHLVEGVRASSFDEQYENIDYVQNILESIDYSMTIQSAYCAQTEAEALQKLTNYRNAIHSRQYLDNYLTWLYGEIGAREDILF